MTVECTVPGIAHAEAIARYAETLHNFLTARALTGWRSGALSTVTTADLDLELSVRAVLTTLDRLRRGNRQNTVKADQWICIHEELARVHRRMVEATG